MTDKFIRDNLEKYSECLIVNPKYKSYISTINPKTISKILTKNFTVGADMKAILCLFTTLLSSSSTNYATKGSIYFPDVNIQEWIKKLDKLQVSSTEGHIYMTQVFSSDIQVVIKVPKESYEMSLQREYFIGLRALNNLRYTIPTFAYTLGAFMCNKPRSDGYIDRKKICEKHSLPFVLYEKIPGKSIGTLLQSNEIGFEGWLVMFAQILLSLEIAQRNYKFTHFDLHSNNVMTRPTKRIGYDISIDN